MRMLSTLPGVSHLEDLASQGIHVFVSYAHADRKWLNRLEVHLKPLRELCQLEPWADTRIRPGSKWRDEIRMAVDRASVAILLVSADFLASDFIRTDELPPLLQAAEQNGAVILPIIVSPCLFSHIQHLAQFQAVNDPASSLVNVPYGEQEAVMVRVADTILSIARSAAVSRTELHMPKPSTRSAEDFLDPKSFTQLIKIGDWIFDQSKPCIVGTGMNAFLVSREEYGAAPFRAKTIVSFRNFAYPTNGKLGMNSGLVFGWNNEKQRPRYYNVVLSGGDLRLERIGFQPPPARTWEHLTEPKPFHIEAGRSVELMLQVDTEKISVDVNGANVIAFPRPPGVTGRVGLRPWRSQLECTEFLVSTV